MSPAGAASLNGGNVSGSEVDAAASRQVGVRRREVLD